MTDERIEQHHAPLSEPTDPRIAEIAARQQKANTEHLASGAHADNWDEECPACVGQLESETHANRDRFYLLNALSLLQQRLEQVTAEREDLRRAIHGGDLHRTLSHAILVSTANDQRAAEEELNGDGGVRAKLEAAEATIASLSADLAHWKDCHGVTADRLEALRASLQDVTDNMDRAGGDSYGMPECPWCRSQFNDNAHNGDCALVKAREVLTSLPSSAVSRTAERQP